MTKDPVPHQTDTDKDKDEKKEKKETYIKTKKNIWQRTSARTNGLITTSSSILDLQSMFKPKLSPYWPMLSWSALHVMYCLKIPFLT